MIVRTARVKRLGGMVGSEEGEGRYVGALIGVCIDASPFFYTIVFGS